MKWKPFFSVAKNRVQSPAVFALFLPLLFQIAVLADSAHKPEPETSEAFDRYLKSYEESLETRLDGRRAFLWLEERGPEARRRVVDGEVLTHHFGEGADIPGGLIHNWLGVAFVPRVTASGMINLLTDYDRHRDIYEEVVDSKTLGKGEGWVMGYLRFENKRFVTVVLDTEHEARISQVGPKRWFMRSRALRISEVRNPGQSDEEKLQPGEGRGFLWRMNAYWRLEEVDGGVILESNVVTLSRSIPWIVAWLVKPIVKRFPRDTLERTLLATREAAGPAFAGKPASSPGNGE